MHARRAPRPHGPRPVAIVPALVHPVVRTVVHPAMALVATTLLVIALAIATLPARANAAPADRVTLCHRTGSETNPFVRIEVAQSALAAHLAHGDQPSAGGACLGELVACGGFAGIPCPDGTVCVDDPRDLCSPDCGGADCGGICAVPVIDDDGDLVPCGGPDDLDCEGPGEVCIDVPGDGCDDACGGTDCFGTCFVPIAPEEG